MAVKDIRAVLKKYRGAVLVLLCGIALMCLPRQQETKKAAVPEVQQQTLEQALEKILSQVSGAGEVRVLLSGQLSETKRYQTDDTQSGSGELRQETALVRQTEAATYRGAIVVCQGAENPKVALSVVQAVAAVTGLSTNRITVLKMK